MSRQLTPCFLLALIQENGYSLRQLAFSNGYKSPTSLSRALRKPNARAAKIIVAATGMPASKIWPGINISEDAATPGRPKMKGLVLAA